MAKRKHRYMVGYTSENSTAFGKDYNGGTQRADPMTLLQAKRYLPKLQSNTPKAIFELVPVKLIPRMPKAAK